MCSPCAATAASYYYLAGSDALETMVRVIKLDRRIEKPTMLQEIISEDPLIYSKREFYEINDNY